MIHFKNYVVRTHKIKLQLWEICFLCWFFPSDDLFSQIHGYWNQLDLNSAQTAFMTSGFVESFRYLRVFGNFTFNYVVITFLPPSKTYVPKHNSHDYHTFFFVSFWVTLSTSHSKHFQSILLRLHSVLCDKLLSANNVNCKQEILLQLYILPVNRVLSHHQFNEQSTI